MSDMQDDVDDDNDEAFGGDDDDFDFVELVAHAHRNWRLLTQSLTCVPQLCDAVQELVGNLAPYLDATKIDDPLVTRLEGLKLALNEVQYGAKQAGYANREIRDAFLDLQRGMQAAHDMNNLAMTVGFGNG